MGKAPERPARPNRIDTVVTFLEMTKPPTAAPWLWYERRLLDDAALAAIIGDPRVEVYVLRAGGAVAGYSELDMQTSPDIDIAYFGLAPEFIGRRLGPYLLGWTVARA
jgi:hypothetical protein